MGIGRRLVYGLYLLSGLSVVVGIHVEFQQPEYEVARGDQVSLTCIFRPEAPSPKVAVITWTADADDPAEPQIAIGTYFYSSGPTGTQLDINADYEGKATMTNDVPAGVSTLTFPKVTMQENRVFQCAVQIPGDNDGQQADTTRLVVLVAPSVPVCNIQGAAEYGNNINLTCKSEEGSPAPTYKWERFDPSNRPLNFPPRTTENNGVLSLFNVSRETSGYYICTSTNKIRSASYNMTLSVMPPSMKIGSTAGIIGGCVAGLVVLIIVVYCCCRRKKKKEAAEHGTREYGMEEHAAYHDKPPSEMGKERDGNTVDRYEDTREVSLIPRTGFQDDRSEQYDNHSRQDDNREDRRGSSDRLDRYEDSRRGSSDRLDRYEDSRRGSSDRLDRYEDSRRGSFDRLDRHDDDSRYRSADRSADRSDRYGNGRSGSSDRLDRYIDKRGRSKERLDRYDDSRGRSRERLDRYEDGRGRSNDRLDRYDDTRSRSSDRLDRYDDNRSRSSDRLDRYEGDRDRYDDRRDDYSVGV
ncbi:cell surface A33 antigen [Engraulis encrasicolus]|uniref:cell surface A33 antigen n=1 Tax=Engraulis encrasicolus TaxID=184585 RepID=UPI002FD31382